MTKKTSRIPGVSVGQTVGTSVGPKKKVCFTIGGKTFFRMVEPDWSAPGRPPITRSRRKPTARTRAKK